MLSACHSLCPRPALVPSPSVLVAHASQFSSLRSVCARGGEGIAGLRLVGRARFRLDPRAEDRSDRSDGGVGGYSGCVSTSAGVGVFGGGEEILASVVGGLWEPVTHTGGRASHPSRETPRLMAQMSNETDEIPQLPEGLDASAMPKHVAIIMDGNSRWAERRRLPASMGHEAGVRSLKEVVKLAHVWGIKVLTVFAFSTENWLRPTMEVDFLMTLFENVLKNELSSLAKENVRVHCMGDLTLLPESLRNMVSTLDEHTKHNTGLKFCIALSYSGRYDIANACRKLAAKVEAGELSSSDITETAIEEELKTSWLGDARNPDLLIRTSGEQRLSNFLLWQTAYTEFYFVDSLWPDFGASQLTEALLAYQNRNRRFGKRK